MGGKQGGSRLSRPSLTLPLFSKIPQDLVNQKSERYFPPSVSILFYRNGWRINLWWMCVYRMCYQANVLISWSFWLHGLYGSDVPFPMISLSHILTNAFPSKKMKCLLPRCFLGPNLHFNLFLWPPLLQACDLIFWTIDGNLALFQWPPSPPLPGWRPMWPGPETRPRHHNRDTRHQARQRLNLHHLHISDTGYSLQHQTTAIIYIHKKIMEKKYLDCSKTI